MKSYEIQYKGYSFPVILLPNGKRIVDVYSNDAPLFCDESDKIREEIKQILGV